MTDSMVADAVTSILDDRLDTDEHAAAERDGWSPRLWSALADGGFTAIGVPEAAGGSGGDLADACDLLIAAGRHATPLPLVEAGLLGGWALAAAGLPLPPGPLTAAVGDLTISGGTVTGTLDQVPWASYAELIVTVAGGHVVALRPDQVRIVPGHNLAGEPRDHVHVDRVTAALLAPAPPGVTSEVFRWRGAFGYAAMMAGAMERVRDLTVRYTGERQQFGRPIARFQAVGALLVRIAEEAAVTVTAVRSAADQGGVSEAGAAIAKIVAGQAATTVAAAAHQAHGAIGMTREYELGRLTRRLWAWRDAYGGERHWSGVLGRIVAGQGADLLWPLVLGDGPLVLRDEALVLRDEPR